MRLTLPRRLKPDQAVVRTGLLQRLSASRQFAFGDRRGVLKAAGNRSARPFRLDVKQRVIVKALVSRHIGSGAARSSALAAHLAYLQRPGAGRDGASAGVFDARQDDVDASGRLQDWSTHRHHFRFIVSPEHGDRLADLTDYTRELMRRVAADLGEPTLDWMAVCHFDTDQPHAHILVAGRRASGRDLVIPRDYIAYGFRARAQELAQERLGDLSRLEAERRIWRETQAHRFTAFDRRLLSSADGNLSVSDHAGRSDAWAALMRGRLSALEAIGLATRDGDRFILASDMEGRLKQLQISRDIIRTLNQHRLGVEGLVAIGRPGVVRGRVTRFGCHDELGAAPFAFVRNSDGAEIYVRLAQGSALKVGKSAEISIDARGLGRPVVERKLQL